MTSNGLWTTDPIDMTSSSGQQLAAPGTAWAGQAFQVTWLAPD